MFGLEDDHIGSHANRKGASIRQTDRPRGQ
jgi:hypothetical protein